ncbi:hypothetical protein GCM10010466_29530 [Planomonospora alba]|uniref:Uncharacterized protein n=1 Tax=Planomonospora alba TaxID=161354 RepID=A0ABP6N548_9ACTN
MCDHAKGCTDPVAFDYAGADSEPTHTEVCVSGAVALVEAGEAPEAFFPVIAEIDGIEPIEWLKALAG